MQTRPTGTVTFLFTDIEGSTTRWEHTPQEMAAAFARQEAILRAAIAAYDGWAYKQIGDAFQAAFQTAPAALAAALAAQQTLAAEPWPAAIGAVQVRMALHTGSTEERGDDYVGPLLNRAARLLAAGHGGQILLTATVYELVRDTLPAEVELRDLGERRLKDLIRPEHIWQVIIAGLPSDFPPLKTLDSRPNNLPAQPNAFIGRERETAAVVARLRQPDVRLLTLTGPGGTGKTRLALQVAADLLDDFPDGAFFVALAPLTDPDLVVPTIARTLGVQEGGERPPLAVLLDVLRPRARLLVLDNFEHVAAAAGVLPALLQAAPQLKLLVTSRVPLQVYGEKEHPVHPLALPDRAHPPPPAQLGQYAAVRLFIERARDVRPEFAVTNATAPAVAEICWRLDGLPLAIELAAARVRLFAPDALLARLDQRLVVLTGGARDRPARQQTLRGAISWSHDLLTPGEQQLFRRLAVFQGGRTLEAIAAVCGEEAGLDEVEALVRHNLLQQRTGRAGEPRFWMLETIHEYAREQLRASGEAEALGWQHACYYLGLAEAAEPGLLGPQQLVWLDRLEDEFDNFRAALRWSLDRGAPETALRTAGALWMFWWHHSHFREGRQWLEEALAQTAGPGGARPAARAKALNALGLMLQLLGATVESERVFAASLAVFRQVGDRWWEAEVLTNLGMSAIEQEQVDRARQLFEQSLDIGRDVDDRGWHPGRAIHNLGSVARTQGDFAEAERLYTESLALLEPAAKHTLRLRNILFLSVLRRQQRDFPAAARLLQQAVALAREFRDQDTLADCLEEGAYQGAGQGQPARAARLAGAAEAVRQAMGQARPPLDAQELARSLAPARAQVPPDVWRQAWEEGTALTLEAALALLLEEAPPHA